MAVSKRLRYEIFRRDNFQCRYCGAKPPETELKIDHLVPLSLGGTDKPENLVTACEPCNSGKSSTTPDATIVADVEQDAIRWARAVRVAVHSMEQEKWIAEQRNAGFRELWELWGHGPTREKVPLPVDWAQSLKQLRDAGLSEELLAEAINIAMGTRTVRVENTFRYFCGVCWRMAAEIQTRARAVVDTFEEED